MKTPLTFLLFIFIAVSGFAQKQLISYEDLKYLLHNNLQQADTFLMAKGYTATSKNNDTKNRKYTISLKDNNFVNINVRADGKRLFMEIETNDLNQYSLIYESIKPYINKDFLTADIQTYSVKDLGSIYIAINDTQPYNPLKKDYDIHVVSDGHITAYN